MMGEPLGNAPVTAPSFWLRCPDRRNLVPQIVTQGLATQSKPSVSSPPSEGWRAAPGWVKGERQNTPEVPLIQGDESSSLPLVKRVRGESRGVVATFFHPFCAAPRHARLLRSLATEGVQLPHRADI